MNVLNYKRNVLVSFMCHSVTKYFLYSNMVLSYTVYYKETEYQNKAHTTG